MPKRYDKDRIYRLFLEFKGNISTVMSHDDTPKSRKTIRKYAKDGGWYKELSSSNVNTDNKITKGYKFDKKVLNADSDDIEKLEKVRSTLYKFLVSESLENQVNLELKPKTYTEAVKCYLDIDSRIEEKKNKTSGSESKSWEEIIKRCISLNA